MANGLWLRNWNVLDETEPRTFDEPKVFTAECSEAPEACKHCGVIGRLYRHGPLTVEYKDAPAFGHRVVIKAIVQRYRCRECGKTMMQPLPGIDSRRSMTERLIRYIEEQSIYQTAASLERILGVDEKTIREIGDAYLIRAMKAHVVEAPLVLGVDELTILGKKRSIFVDIVDKKLLDIIDSMDKQAVVRWMNNLPNKERVQVVTMDMWGAYRNVVAEVMPWAICVVDKWHIVSKANGKLDAVRNRFRRTATNKRDRRNPHRGRRLLHAHGKNLTVQRRFLLEGVLLNNPLLNDAWHAKESFYAIWETNDRAEAERRFEAWEKSIPDTVPEFKDLAKTVRDWHVEIFNYFKRPFTNAYTEARNRLVKDFARAGRGYRFPKIRAKAVLAQPFTSQPLVVCELCLRRFENDMQHSSIQEDPNHPGKMRLLCRSCTLDVHNVRMMAHWGFSTPKSG
jgi:transposase